MDMIDYDKLTKEQLINLVKDYDTELKDCLNEKSIGKSRRRVREFLRKLYRKYNS